MNLSALMEWVLRGFKSSGFNLEDTNLTDCDRLQNLLCVMAIAYCIAYKIGEITIETKPLIIKSQGYPPKSIFRIGLDEIKNAIANITRKYNYIKTLVCRVISIALSGLSLKEKIVR